MIPATVIHCVNEVAARGLIQTGIYRVPGAEKRVLELLDKFFYSKATPSLALIDDINVVCSCLKSFLRMLSEPLVTFAMRPGFLEAAQLAEKGDAEAAKYRVASLLDAMPIPNRDTLAFIILHLQVSTSQPHVACPDGQNTSYHSLASFSYHRLYRVLQCAKWMRLIFRRCLATRWSATPAVTYHWTMLLARLVGNIR